VLFLYQGLLVMKLVSVMGFAGGLIAAFIGNDRATRKFAAHRVASPSLLAIWLFGYALLALNGWPLFEFWVVGALALSLVANAALAYCVARDRRSTRAFMGTASPVVASVVLMVLKSTWAQVLP